MFLLALCVSVTAFAVDEASLGIKVRKQSGMNYVTGGLGDEAQSFVEISGRYPVHLRLQVDGRNIDTRGVKVRVLDAKGDSVVEADAEGPFFYVSPPSGRWTFEVEWQGQKLSQTKDLTGRRYLDIGFDFKTAQ